MNSKEINGKIAIIYQMYYKLMKITSAPKAKMVTNEGFIILMDAYLNNTYVPRIKNWDDVLIKDYWHFDCVKEQEI